MTRRATTGSTAPAWVRERIEGFERAWPLWVLGAALAGVIVVSLVLLGVLWSAEPPVYYALP
jgi:integral membrane sensor domain MASE1